ncbi:hypothetical protein QCA50_008989 [Cerrena zonata]|uniref:Glycopeptide n=1 Tax=Cerrena zonata TaxID=2478898 RepID=A0AAW0G9E7_9APHY
MVSLRSILAPTLSLLAAVHVYAETHTIVFENHRGFGTPILKLPNGPTLSTGAAFTINGPLIGAIAFLQTGSCGTNGEGCTVIEITLKNPSSPGTGSTVVIDPTQFSVTTGFGYFNGCDGIGQDCTNPNCPSPLPPNGLCPTNDVNLAIVFCD